MQPAHARRWHWLVTMLSLLQAAACGGAIKDPAPFEPGLLDLELQPAAAVRFENVSYGLDRSDGFSRSGPVAVSLSDEQESFSFQVDDLQPATYLLTVDADATVTADASHTHCRGRTSFSIESGKTTTVALRVQCDGVVSTGSKVGTRVNECPVIVTLRASPSNASVGEAVALQVEVRDDMIAAAPLSYTWSSSDGSVLGSAATTNFRCKAAGPAHVYVAVSDGDSACKQSVSMVDVLCTDARCLAAGNCASVGGVAAAGRGAATSTAGTMARSVPTQPAAPASAGQGGMGSAAGSGGAGSIAPRTVPQAGRVAPVTPSVTRSVTGAAGAPRTTSPRANGGMGGSVLVAPSGGAGDAALAGSGAAGVGAGVEASGGAGAESAAPIAGSTAAGVEAPAAGSGGVPATAEQGGGAGEPPRGEHPHDDDTDSDEGERHRRRDGAAGAQPESAGAGGSTLILTTP